MRIVFMGTPDFAISARAVLFCGMRTATVLSPAVTSSGTRSLFGATIVSGPGQKVSIRICACFGILLQSWRTSLFFATCSISGLSEGLPFAAKIFATAAPLSPSAPSP